MNKKNKIILIISSIAAVIFISLHNILNDSLKDLIDSILLIIGTLIVVLLIAKELIKSNKNKKTILEEDKIEVKKYIEKYRKIDLNIDTKKAIKYVGYWYIFEEVENLYNLCKDFLKGTKLYEDKKDITKSVEELEQYIRTNNIKELKQLSKDNYRILEIIFNYYDEKGDWKNE